MNSQEKMMISCYEDETEHGLRLEGYQHTQGDGPILISSRGIEELKQKVKSSK